MLLTSTVLAASVVRLSQKHVMVQELYCIETLARVDVLCLDKTGTITEGTMDCKDLVLLDDSFEADAPKALASLVAALEDRNATFSAIEKAYSDPTPWAATKQPPSPAAPNGQVPHLKVRAPIFWVRQNLFCPCAAAVCKKHCSTIVRNTVFCSLPTSSEALPSEGLPAKLQSCSG